VQTTRLYESFEGWNSSLPCTRGEVLKIEMAPVEDSMHFLQFSDLGVKCVFWAITFVPDMLEGQSRALSTREIMEFPKRVWAKILAHWIGVQGQSKLVKNSKTVLIWELLQGEPLTQIKNFFNRN